MNDRERRIARARLLRRQGKTYNEIRDVVGGVDDKTLREWCRGIPRPPETRRSCPKTELRRRCRELRRQGLTYSEIAEATGASAGSISPWVRDVRIQSRERGERRRLEALRESARTRNRSAQRRREFASAYAASSIGPLSDRELFLLGVGLYWAEGSKSKDYDVREHVVFVNSDATMVQVFMAWLSLVGISIAQCRFRVAIHETANIGAAESFWADLIGVPRDDLSRTTVKRHRPLTNRLNQGETYRGCLVISVLKSAPLYRAIDGWWKGLHGQVSQSHRRSADWSDLPPWGSWQSRTPLER